MKLRYHVTNLCVALGRETPDREVMEAVRIISDGVRHLKVVEPVPTPTALYP